MAIKSRSVLKEYFENGDKPNENQFWDLIDSLVHVNEGGGNTSEGPAGTGVINDITTDNDGNLVFSFVGGTSLSTGSRGGFSVGGGASGARSIIENDYNNPDFEIPVSQSSASLDLFDNTKQDFIFNYAGKIGNQIIDGFHCMGHEFTNINFNRVNPYFSRKLLHDKGYETGDMMRIGMWVKIPSASEEVRRRFYFSPTGINREREVFTNEWVWYEIDSDIEITDDEWIGFYLGCRDLLSRERWFMRGMTILNVTKKTWVGELKNTEIEKERYLPIVNQFPNSRYIQEGTLIYSSIYDQEGGAFTKSILKDQIIGNDLVDVIETEGEIDSRSRINFLIVNTPPRSDWRPDTLLINQNSNGIVIKIGVFIRVDADAELFNVGFLNDVFRKDTTFKNRWRRQTNFGEWRWYESLPVVLTADELKVLDNLLLQVDCTPNSGTVKIQLAGLTITTNSNPLSFRPQIPKNIASGNRFYNKLWSSYGDSTVGSGGWQTVANRYMGTEHQNRGIGGSTIFYNGATAFIDANGNTFSDRNNPPTEGIEGVDWFKISTSMCTDDRINTISENSQLITLTAGINDFTQNAELGSIKDVPSDLQGNTFYAACKSLVEKLQARCPNAIIINVTFNFLKGEETRLNKKGYMADDYRNALKEVFNIYGLKVIDTKVLGVNSANHSNYSRDGTHPNRQYEKMIGGLFASNVPTHREYDYIKFS